jgi:hypothetical protein
LFVLLSNSVCINKMNKVTDNIIDNIYFTDCITIIQLT